MTAYGYCRISRKTQNIERQERNIKDAFPDAIIVKEAFTGTKIQGRKELDKLLNNLKSEDTLVFDSASRMSRNVTEAIKLYEELFKKGINLVFLKDPHINTDVYKRTRDNQINIALNTGDVATDTFVGTVIDALNRYMVDLAKEQIRIVFAQAEKEVEDLHQRTREGIETARLNGKQIGQKPGVKLTTKKSVEAKKVIVKYSRDFNGVYDDEAVMHKAGISRNTFYKYKRELREAIADDSSKR